MTRTPISSRGLQNLLRILLIALACGTSFPVAAQQPARAVATVGLPNIEGVLLNALLGIAKVRLSNGMVPILYQVDGRRAVTITSNRLSIARANAEAIEKGGRYTPPNDLLVDAVMVSCGSADRIDRIFNCKRLAVSTSAGPIKPIFYKAGSETFRNALGAAWEALTVIARYDASVLREGFSVDVDADNGTSWTFATAVKDVEGKLFLLIDPTTGILNDCVTKAQC